MAFDWYREDNAVSNDDLLQLQADTKSDVFKRICRYLEIRWLKLGDMEDWAATERDATLMAGARRELTEVMKLRNRILQDLQSRNITLDTSDG